MNKPGVRECTMRVMWRCGRSARTALAAFAVAGGCSGGERRTIRIERVMPVADPTCGAPVDARTMLVAAIGDFPAGDATVRSLDVGGGDEVELDGFPEDTRALEIEVLGLGGAVRAI